MSDDSRGNGGIDSFDSESSADTNIHNQKYARTVLDRYHIILANNRRRRILTYLIEKPGGPVSVEELIDIVAESEMIDHGSHSHRERIAIDLHHVHLPKIAEKGVIEYDLEDKVVRYNGDEKLAELLAFTNEINEREDR